MIQIIAPERGQDVHGSGAWKAARTNGRLHRGVDYACWPGSRVRSMTSGIFTRLGFPYKQDEGKPGKSSLRYVQITTPKGYHVRYFYVMPADHKHGLIEIGDDICRGQVIGITQDLSQIYPGITPHIHLEISKNRKYFNPVSFLKDFLHQ